MTEPDGRPIPPHACEVTEVARTTAQMRTRHKQEASALQQAVDRLTAIVGWPGFVALLGLTSLGWIGINLVTVRLGFAPVDPPPFAGLEFVAAIGALLIAALILTTQRREDQLADFRSQLILELSISNDQKIAKIIELLEESRRDNPEIVDRVDDQAAAMSTPSDTEAVLEAIKVLRDDSV